MMMVVVMVVMMVMVAMMAMMLTMVRTKETVEVEEHKVELEEGGVRLKLTVVLNIIIIIIIIISRNMCAPDQSLLNVLKGCAHVFN